MKRATRILIFLWLASGACDMRAAQEVWRRQVLDYSSVHRIPVAVDRVTTVMFPFDISGLEAAFISQEPTFTSRFLLSFQPGNRYFSLRALSRGVTANLNVISGPEVYALEFRETNEAAYVVEFIRQSPPTSPVRTAPAPAPAPVTATHQTARSPLRVRSIPPPQPGLTEHVKPRRPVDYSSYSILVEEIYRCRETGVITYHTTVFNRRDRAFLYVPGRTEVVLGSNTYIAVKAQASGYVPAHSNESLVFTIKVPTNSRLNTRPLSHSAGIVLRQAKRGPWAVLTAPVRCVSNLFGRDSQPPPVSVFDRSDSLGSAESDVDRSHGLSSHAQSPSTTDFDEIGQLRLRRIPATGNRPFAPRPTGSGASNLSNASAFP